MLEQGQFPLAKFNLLPWFSDPFNYLDSLVTFATGEAEGSSFVFKNCSASDQLKAVNKTDSNNQTARDFFIAD